MGRASQKEKERSRERILDSAARLMRERGIEGASLGDIMSDAGLTHGAFYRHFATKDALLQSALAAAFDQMTSLPQEKGAGLSFRDAYLSVEHLENPGQGCPAAALAGEIARGPEATRQVFTAGVKAMIAVLAEAGEGDQAAAARELAMLVGAVVLARASEPDFARELLAAVRAAPLDGR